MDQERFFQKIDKTLGCWEFTGAKDRLGYGIFWVQGKTIRAHRYSWMIHFGPIPLGLEVCHKCDNSACINPSHLKLGTKLENLRDKTRRGRTSKGILNGRSKLTPTKVQSIRRRLIAKETKASLAREFGVSRKNILLIERGEIW